MSDTLKPRDSKDVEQAVAWALAEGKTLELLGHGSKRALGRAAQWDLSLDLSDLSGVTLYEPEELVLSAKAGTPMTEIEALLAKSNQELAFEPPDYGPLLGKAPGRGTIGGILATNLSGPRRLKAGAARDHFLGVTTVSGRAETFKSGGRVVKNVTGYDMCKVLAGSYGTLGAMTDVTVKVLPRAETEQTVLVLGLDDAKAAQAMSLAMGSSNEVSGAAHLPAPLAASVQAEAGTSLTALRLEGVAPSVAHRRNALENLLKPFGEIAVFEEPASRALWKSLRDVAPFASSLIPPLKGEGRREAPGRGHGADPHPTAARSTSPLQGEVGERVVWRISVAPTHGHHVANAIGDGAEFFYDWAGGLIWVAMPPANDGGAAAVRRALGGNGHATLIRAPAAIRAAVAVFEPQDAGLAALTKRVKESFDPKGIFGPGRMWAGI
jgi:glycolate oxidase FAD binding subunit